MICAESLQEMDTDVSGTIKLDNHEKSLERRRDVIKKTASGMEFVLLGIESQQHIHYAMPLRNMLYDGMGYLKEYRSLPQKKYKTSDEFLSGIEQWIKSRTTGRRKCNHLPDAGQWFDIR